MKKIIFEGSGCAIVTPFTKDNTINYEEFKKVQISGLSIEWENGADICPDELYNNSRQILEE